MLTISPLEEKNAAEIVRWNDGCDERFLMQWSGRGYVFPITEEQIRLRLYDGAEIFQAAENGVMAATIEIIGRYDDDRSAHLGRFIVDRSRTGKGIGTEVLTLFMEYCRDRYAFTKLSLTVFEYNTAAMMCYKKCGFVEVSREERGNGVVAVRMEKMI